VFAGIKELDFPEAHIQESLEPCNFSKVYRNFMGSMINYCWDLSRLMPDFSIFDFKSDKFLLRIDFIFQESKECFRSEYLMLIEEI